MSRNTLDPFRACYFPVSNAMAPVVSASSLTNARTAMGLGDMAEQDSNAVNITGGTITGVSVSASTRFNVIETFNTVDLEVANFTASPNESYQCDTSGGGSVAINLPSLADFDPDQEGLIVQVTCFNLTLAYTVTIVPDGGDLITGPTGPANYTVTLTEGQSIGVMIGQGAGNWTLIW